MSQVLSITIDQYRGALASPPLVDDLTLDPQSGSVAVTIIPDDLVSTQEKVGLSVRRDDREGRRITEAIASIEAACGQRGQLRRVVHEGGARYSLHFELGVLELGSEGIDSASTVRVLDALKVIAEVAQIRLQADQHTKAPRWPGTVSIVFSR